MALHVYNTLTRRREPFVPRTAGHVRMYVCGPTVYDEPHIGHARSAYLFDVMRTYLSQQYQVRFVRNVTDVDDKILERARADGRPAEDVAAQYLQAYHEAMDLLGIARPDAEPRATEHIDEMIELISQLVVREMAYAAEGNVFFAVRKFPRYGQLSHQRLDAMQVGTRAEPEPGKQFPLDFALWKAAKPDELSWESPWGRGRPGWHVECSAMSMRCLDAEQIDIHGGGLDLIFPHHENEAAQSEGATGVHPFATYWLHHGLLTIHGHKMSKSSGNFVTVRAAVDQYGSRALKLFYLSAHYRSPIDYAESQLGAAAKMAERFDVAFQRLDTAPAATGTPAPELTIYREKFAAAMDDDVNTPAALAAMFELITWIHKQCDAQQAIPVPAITQFLLEAGQLFGLFREPENPLDQSVMARIDDRNAARQRKAFADADAIRAELLTQGVILEDTPQGTIWRRKR